MMAYTFVRQSRFKSNLSDRLRRPALLLGEPFIKRQTSYIKLLFPSGLDGGDEFLGRIRDLIGRLAATGEGTAGTDGDAAGFDPITGIFDVDAACRHERSLRQGAVDGLDGFHAQDFPGEDFDDVSAVFQGRNDAVEGRRPRHDGDAVAVADLDRFHVQCRRYDELGAGEDGNAGRNKA